jgi:uncharacterized protein (DUF885 family)
MTTRRDLMLSAAALAMTPVTGALAQPAAAARSPAGVRLDALFSDIMQARLARHPELATGLGLDKGALAGAKSRLSDASLSGVAADKAQTASELEKLQAFDAAALTGLDATNYQAVIYGLKGAAAANAQFDFGENGGRSPYVLSQLTGAYQDIPTFLDTQHKIETAVDADAYLARLQAFATVLDQETERARHDADMGGDPARLHPGQGPDPDGAAARSAGRKLHPGRFHHPPHP